MSEQHTPKPFAKVFEREGHQVLVHIDIDEEEGRPAISVSFPVADLGFHKLTFALKDGVDKHEAFAEVTEDAAFALRNEAMQAFGAMFKGANAASEEKPKLNVGDRVKITRLSSKHDGPVYFESYPQGIVVGNTGIIKEVISDRLYNVRTDNAEQPDDGDGIGYAFFEDMIEKIEEGA